MYSKVIVPLDGSELSSQALPYAQLVARSLSAPIELVQAYDILPPGMLGTQSQSVIDQITDSARDRAAGSLEPVRETLAADGHSVSAFVQRGSAAEAIVAQASTDPTALVVMCTHGRGGIARWVLGSVTDRVLHTIPNPMLIVRSTVTGPASPESSLQKVRGASGRLAARRVCAAPRRHHCHRAVRWNPYHPRNAHAGPLSSAAPGIRPGHGRHPPNSIRFPLKNWWQPTPTRSPSIWKT